MAKDLVRTNCPGTALSSYVLLRTMIVRNAIEAGKTEKRCPSYKKFSSFTVTLSKVGHSGSTMPDVERLPTIQSTYMYGWLSSSREQHFHEAPDGPVTFSSQGMKIFHRTRPRNKFRLNNLFGKC